MPTGEERGLLTMADDRRRQAHGRSPLTHGKGGNGFRDEHCQVLSFSLGESCVRRIRRKVRRSNGRQQLPGRAVMMSTATRWAAVSLAAAMSRPVERR